MADPDPATGAWRNIHWYAAKPCNDIERDEACMPLQDDREKFSTFWFSETEALSRLKLDDEKFSKFCLARRSLTLVRDCEAAIGRKASTLDGTT